MNNFIKEELIKIADILDNLGKHVHATSVDNILKIANDAQTQSLTEGWKSYPSDGIVEGVPSSSYARYGDGYYFFKNRNGRWFIDLYVPPNNVSLYMGTLRHIFQSNIDAWFDFAQNLEHVRESGDQLIADLTTAIEESQGQRRRRASQNFMGITNRVTDYVINYDIVASQVQSIGGFASHLAELSSLGIRGHSIDYWLGTLESYWIENFASISQADEAAEELTELSEEGLDL